MNNENPLKFTFIDKFLLEYALTNGKIDPYKIIQEKRIEVSIIMESLEILITNNYLYLNDKDEIVLSLGKEEEIKQIIKNFIGTLPKEWKEVPESFQYKKEGEVYIPTNFINDRKTGVQS